MTSRGIPAPWWAQNADRDGCEGMFAAWRRGGRARRGDVRVAALSLLAEQPRNGYQIIQEISERTGARWRPSPGSVYPALAQLTDEELVGAVEADGRRVFTLTDAGRAYVEEHRGELAATWDAVADPADQGVIDMRELLGQVAGATMHVLRSASPAQLDAARQVLAKTRRSLYQILADGDET